MQYSYLFINFLDKLVMIYNINIYIQSENNSISFSSSLLFFLSYFAKIDILITILNNSLSSINNKYLY